MKTLVLGLGNPLLGDDAVGLRVAASLRGRLPPDVELDEDYCGGLRLMERLAGYDRAVGAWLNRDFARVETLRGSGRRSPTLDVWLRRVQ